ncbi:MAG: putative glycolipid-binding domain-containing protein [Acidimicrobiales bacterium]|nr:putative glycolipid-binding domain-containing protein [Acidimicrobiales bacterium]
MIFPDTPRSACWHHTGRRDGFEVAYFTRGVHGWLIEGTTTGIQDGVTWAVDYRLQLDESWRTRHAQISGRTEAQAVVRQVEGDGGGHWRVDGHGAAHLDGCLDVDMEVSALTNALPVHRLRLGVGQSASAPAAYVRLADAAVDRLEQHYARVGDPPGRRQRFDYHAPAFDFRCQLDYDETGLVLDYPGIARRAG